MATISYTEMFWGIVCLFFLYHWIRDRKSLFISWPVIGKLPGALWNVQHLHQYVYKSLKRRGGTYKFRGPHFCNMDFLVTSDPLNTHHILSKHSSNYTKGPDFAKLFEPLGEGILAVDSDAWKFQRKMIHSYLKDTKFELFLEATIHEKVVNSLFPVLDHFCINKMEVNLENVFLRLGFDVACLLFLGRDSECLSVEPPRVAYDKAIDGMLEAVIHRHVVPEQYWELLKWLQIGPEKKLRQGQKICDEFIYQCIASKQEEHLQRKTKTEENQQQEASLDFLTAYLMREEAQAGDPAKIDCKFLRDVTSNLVVSGRDTSGTALSWFFWLLATNQLVETKILEEIKENLMQKQDGKQQKQIFSAQELSKLVYLHAALCETLRLYPSVPIDHKCSVLQDTLPSGHHVKANTKIFLSFYAMGRMEEIWGDDCCEFKPERWIAEDGGIVHVPSYKFTAFGAGPRACLGKDMGFVQMKIIAAAVLLNYHLQLVEDHPVLTSTSVVLHMKHGLKVRVTKRNV